MCMFINSEKEETLVLHILWRLKGGKIIMTQSCIRTKGDFLWIEQIDILKGFNKMNLMINSIYCI